MKPAPLPSRLRRNLWIAAVAVALFTITGFFIVPPVLKTQLEKRLSAELGRTVTVGKVRLNPYALSLTLENFNVRFKEGSGSFLGWNRLYVNFDALASLAGDWVFGEIELDGFHADVSIKPDGSPNFSDILAKLGARPAIPAAPTKPGRPIRVDSLKVGLARVEFSDHSRPKPFATVLGPLTFAVTKFRTVGARGAPCHFEAVTESGEKLAWTGTISAEPFRSLGELSLENIVLAKYAPYYADRMRADLVEGKLSMRGRYEIDLTEGQRALKFLDGVLQLRGIKVLERASQKIAVEVPALDITGVNADALAQKTTVGSVYFAGGHLWVHRQKEGSINLVEMISPAFANLAPAPAAGVSATAPASAPAKLPAFAIGEIGLKDFQVDMADFAAPRPVQLGLKVIQLSLKNVTLADGAVMPLQLSLAWTPRGAVHVEGTVSIKPGLMADLKTDVTGFEALPLGPYMEKFINARFAQGAVTSDLAVHLALRAGQPFAATVAGDVKMEQVGLVNGAHSESLAGIGTLLLKGLKVGTTPQLDVAIDEVDLMDPYAQIVVNRDKSLNLAAMTVAGAKPAGEASISPAAAAPAPKIEIGKVVLSGGEFSFADHSVEPVVRMAINQFGGTIAGLSSINPAKAVVDLKAAVDGVGPVAITGQLAPFGANKHVELKVNFRNVDLLPLSPYSGKYAGYELVRGKLLLDVTFRLDGNKIDATNVITLSQFTFGSPVRSPDATGLPVRLGVALLKDVDGKIVIDVPIQGSTDDPSFRIGKMVSRVVVNLLTKAAVSPFALLGSMFGGGGEELGYQEFAPGETALQPAEGNKLQTMAKALANRPGLSLELEGSYDGPVDTYALKRKKLGETVRRALWDQKHAGSPDIPQPGQWVVSAEENAAMVKQLFDAKFPPGTQFGAPLAQAPLASAPPVAARKSFFGRLVDIVTLKGLRRGKPRHVETAIAVEANSAGGTAATGPSAEEMAGRLAETMEVGDQDLRALAGKRPGGR